VINYIWNLPAGGKLFGNGALAKGLLDNWTLSGISWMTSGTPAELALTISGQDAGNRLLGTYTAGNAAGQQPRFYVNGDPQSDPNAINTAAFVVPGINDRGPYPRFNLRNPGAQVQCLENRDFCGGFFPFLPNLRTSGGGKPFFPFN